MAKLLIRKATQDDAEYILANLRKADLIELTALYGLQLFGPAVCGSVSASDLAWVALLDDMPVCIFGASDLAPGVGTPWLLATEAWYAIPARALMKACDKYMSEILNKYPLVMNYIHAGNTVSIKWLKCLGFEFSATPIPYGKYDEPFYLFWLRGRA